MNPTMKTIPLIVVSAVLNGIVAAATFDVSSPDGNTTAIVTHDESDGILTYKVRSGGVAIIEESPLGIVTDKAEFTGGLAFVESSKSVIDETYTLPQGKVSTYVNRANQLILGFSKNGQKLNVIFRAYDEGVAFRYGSGCSAGFRQILH
jgi:alpha-glucosidase